MATQKIKTEKLIANRVPPGDRWSLVNDETPTVYDSLIEMLETYFNTSQFRGDFVLSPLNGKVFILTEEEIIPDPPKKYNLYGDPS